MTQNGEGERTWIGETPNTMLTVEQVGPYPFFFYAGVRNEPPHIHVDRDDNLAKFWLDPVRLQTSGGFYRIDLRHI